MNKFQFDIGKYRKNVDKHTSYRKYLDAIVFSFGKSTLKEYYMYNSNYFNKIIRIDRILERNIR